MVENGETPRPSRKPRTIPPFAIWLAVGLLGGFGIAFAAMSAMRPASDSNVVVQRDAGQKPRSQPEYSSDQSVPGEPSLLVPKDKAAPVVDPKSNSPTAEYAADRKPGESAPPIASQPKPLPGGSIGTGGMTDPISPVVVVGDKPPAQVDHFEFQELTAETEFDGELAQALATIRKAGGQVLVQFARDPDRPERGTEVYASIDFKEAPKLREALKVAAGAEISHWTGTNIERSSRMMRSLREERSRLAQQLVEYQVRYMDDATQVVDTKAAIERYDKALGALSRIGETKTTFRVLLGR